MRPTNVELRSGVRRAAILMFAACAVAPLAVWHGAGAESPPPGLDMPTIDDGSYVGTAAISAQVSLLLDAGSLDLAMDISGPAELLIEFGAASGTWEMNGPTVIGGAVGPASVVGELLINSSGGFGGEAGDYTMNGSVAMGGSVTVDIPNAGSRTESIDHTAVGGGFVLDDLLFTCDHLYVDFSGEIDQNLSVLAGMAAWSVNGGLVLMREPFNRDLDEQLQELTEAIAEAKREVRASELLSAEEARAMDELYDLLNRSRAFSAQLAGSPCGNDPRYQEIVAGLIEEAVSNLWRRALEQLTGTEHDRDSPEHMRALYDLGAYTNLIVSTGASQTERGAAIVDLSHRMYNDYFLGRALDEVAEAGELLTPAEIVERFSSMDRSGWVYGYYAYAMATGSAMGWTYTYGGVEINPRAVVDAKSERSAAAQSLASGRTRAAAAADDPLVAALAAALGAIGQVDLTTPESGGGDRPLLTWEPVDNAVHYDVVLRDAADVPYWAWRTAESELLVGWIESDPTAPGPRVVEGASWTVTALDAAGAVIAVSQARPISP